MCSNFFFSFFFFLLMPFSKVHGVISASETLNCFLFQGVTHNNCEKMTVQNNLCFGKCSSFHVPGSEDHLYTFCSRCLPSKFSMKRLDLNCTDSVTVVKEIMIVEECKCESRKIKDPVTGSLLSDFYENVHEHN